MIFKKKKLCIKTLIYSIKRHEQITSLILFYNIKEKTWFVEKIIKTLEILEYSEYL